jgi:type IV secretion system protein VirB1
MMPAIVDQYIAACAHDVGFSTMHAIVKVESNGNPWAIGDNTTGKPARPAPRNYQDAVLVAKRLISAGHSIDMGWAQINSKNLPRLGLTVEQVMDPCTNLRAAAFILKGNYVDASRKYGPGQRALLHSLSAYNTGNLHAGSAYVNRVLNAANAAPVTRQLASAIPWRQKNGAGTGIYGTNASTYAQWADVQVTQAPLVVIPVTHQGAQLVSSAGVTVTTKYD